MTGREPCRPPEYDKVSLHLAGSVVAGQQIGWQGLTSHAIWAASACKASPWNRVKISSDLVVLSRDGAFMPAPELAQPDGLDPATLRHLPWCKLRIAACDDPTVRPIWLDLGQSVVLPASSATAAVVGPPVFFEVDASNATRVVPPAGEEQSTIDAWVWVRMEETTCCEPYDVLLTDSATVPASDDGFAQLTIPPRARCLTIHKGNIATLGVEWVLDASNLVVGTAGMPATANQLGLVVPEATHVRLTSGGNPQDVVLVWGLHL